MPRANLNKEKIFRAAADLANRDGFRALSLKKLSAELGIKPPSLFKHTRDLAEIKDAVAALGLTRLRGALKAVDDADATGRLRKICHAYRNLARKFPGEYDAFQETHVRRSPEVYRLAEEVLHILRNSLPDFLTPDNQIHALRFMRSTLHGFTAIESGGGFGLKEDVEESFRLAVEALLSDVSERFR